MTQRGWLIFASVATVLCASPDRATGQAPATAALESYLDQARRDWNVAGLAVAVVRGDSVIFARGFGRRDVRSSEAVGPETVFSIGSMTKLFTAVAAGVLVDEGKVRWDEPLQRYLPRFATADPYVTANVSLRDALTHRSGLDWRLDFLWAGSALTRDQILERVRDFAPDPGFRLGYSYSNVMFVAAGEAVGAAAGTSWENFVRQRLLEPLGMRSSRTGFDGTAPPNVAVPHTNFDGQVAPIARMPTAHIAPAGGIVSSALDLTQWLRFLLAGGQLNGKRLIARATLDEILSPQVVVGPPDRLLRPISNFMLYGMGAEVLDYRGHKVIKHGGRVDGMSSEFVLMPDAGLGVVVLTNTNGEAGVTDLSLPLSYWLLDHFLGAPEVDWSGQFLAERRADLAAQKGEERRALASRARDTKPSLPLSAYVGKYAGPVGNGGQPVDRTAAERIGPFAVVTLEDGRLRLRLGNIDSPLEHWSYDTFRVRWSVLAFPIFAKFEPDGAGGIKRLSVGFAGDFDRVGAPPDPHSP